MSFLRFFAIGEMCREQTRKAIHEDGLQKNQRVKVGRLPRGEIRNKIQGKIDINKWLLYLFGSVPAVGANSLNLRISPLVAM